MDAGSIDKFQGKSAELKLGLLEIEILLYLLNGRSGLGPYADSAKRKLYEARRALLPVEESSEDVTPPPRIASGDARMGSARTKKRNGEFNVWNRMRESSDRILPLFESKRYSGKVDFRKKWP